MYNTILLTLDVSPADRPIIDHVKKLAGIMHSHVILLHVATGPAAQFYGTDSSLANAFGQCVSAKANAAAQTQQQATVSAAKTCAGELNANRSAFKAKYGTFGRCVSQHT